AIAHSSSKRVKCMGRQNRAPASWSAAVLCHFLWPRCPGSSHHIQQPFSAVASSLLTSSPAMLYGRIYQLPFPRAAARLLLLAGIHHVCLAFDFECEHENLAAYPRMIPAAAPAARAEQQQSGGAGRPWLGWGYLFVAIFFISRLLYLAS